MEVSEIAPAFGHDGGAMRFLVLNEFGESVSVDELITQRVLDDGSPHIE